MDLTGQKNDVSALLVKLGLEDLNRKPNHTHAAIPIASYERLCAYLERVQGVVEEMRKGYLDEGIWWPPHDGALATTVGDAIKRWIDELEAK